MAQYTLKNNKEATEMFWDSCRGGSGSWIMCSCGTEWTSECDTEEEYHNKFRYIELEGKTFVQDCKECCKKLARYENWIWNHREEIRDYLRIRVNQHLKWAEQENLLNKIAGIQ